MPLARNEEYGVQKAFKLQKTAYIASHLTHFMPVQIKFYPCKGWVDGWLAKGLHPMNYPYNNDSIMMCLTEAVAKVKEDDAMMGKTNNEIKPIRATTTTDRTAVVAIQRQHHRHKQLKSN